MKKILIVTSPRASSWLENPSEVAQGLLFFASDVSDESCQVSVTTFDRLLFDIRTDNSTVLDTYNDRDLSDFDVIHMRNVDKDIAVLDFARTVGIYAKFHKVKVLEEADQIAEFGKLSQMMLFALSGLSVPHTIACWDHEMFKKSTKALGFPAIVKANNGMKGTDNFKIDSAVQLEKVALNPQQRFIAQEFIENDGDFRVLFIGDYERPLIFKRLPMDGSHLNNTSKGAEAVRYDIADFDARALQMCIEAAQATKRIITGIDIMQDARDGSWVLLEANVNPALSMGAFLEEKKDMYRIMLKNLAEEDL